MNKRMRRTRLSILLVLTMLASVFTPLAAAGAEPEDHTQTEQEADLIREGLSDEDLTVTEPLSSDSVISDDQAVPDPAPPVCSNFQLCH